MMLGVLLSLMILSQTPAPRALGGPAAQCIVQVAVNYGPQKNAFLSGVVVGDGLTVLTDGAVFADAREITVAYTDGELSDAILLRVRTYQQIGVIPLAEKRGQIAALADKKSIPEAEISALAAGAPKPFEFAQTPVRLRPLPGSSGARRWQVTPALQAYYRGGPLLDTEGRLLGILVLDADGRTLVGLALDSVADMVAVAAAPPAPAPKPPEPAKPAVPAAPKETIPAAPTITNLNRPVRAPSGLSWAAIPPPTPAAVAPVVSRTDEVADLIRSCNEMIQQQKYAAAVTCFEGALKRYPDQTPLHYHAAFAYWYKAMYNPDGKRRSSMERVAYRSAMREFEAFLSKSPDDPRAADARVRLELLRSAQYGYRPKQ